MRLCVLKVLLLRCSMLRDGFQPYGWSISLGVSRKHNNIPSAKLLPKITILILLN